MGESGEGGREKKKKTQEVALHQYLPPSKRELKATAATEFGKGSFWEMTGLENINRISKFTSAIEVSVCLGSRLSEQTIIRRKREA